MFEFLVCFLVCLLVGLLIKSSDADGDNVAMMIMMVVTMNNSNDLVVMICNHGDVSVWDGFKAQKPIQNRFTFEEVSLAVSLGRCRADLPN